jgi:hypothetical protein
VVTIRSDTADGLIFLRRAEKVSLEKTLAQ